MSINEAFSSCVSRPQYAQQFKQSMFSSLAVIYQNKTVVKETLNVVVIWKGRQ